MQSGRWIADAELRRARGLPRGCQRLAARIFSDNAPPSKREIPCQRKLRLCSGCRLCSGGGAALQRLADLQRPGCGFAAAGGFAPAGVRLCSGWRLRSGRGAALQLMAASQRRSRAAALQRLAALQRPEERKRLALPSGSHSDSGGSCRRGDCSTRSGSAHIAQNNANNIANVRRRSTVFAHECESSLNIPRRVHHDARMLSAKSVHEQS